MNSFDQNLDAVAAAVAQNARVRAQHEQANQTRALANQLGSLGAGFEIGQRGGHFAINKGRETWDKGAERLPLVVEGALWTVGLVGLTTLGIKAWKSLK